KVGELLTRSQSPRSLYHCLMSKCDSAPQIVREACEPATLMTDRNYCADLTDFTQSAMAFDMISYLPGDILAKVDRSSIGVSLETRAPLLDHRLVEFSCQLPIHLKVRQGQGKWLLRQLLYKYVPASLVGRSKMGFCIPVGVWLRGPLYEWADALLDEKRL